MKVELLTARAHFCPKRKAFVSQNIGDVIEVEHAEGTKLIEAGQAKEAKQAK